LGNILNIIKILTGTLGRIFGKILLAIGVILIIVGLVLSAFIITAIIGVPILILGLVIALIGAALNAKGYIAVNKAMNKDHIAYKKTKTDRNIIDAEFVEKNEKDNMEKI
jgi:hypothetical protein